MHRELAKPPGGLSKFKSVAGTAQTMLPVGPGVGARPGASAEPLKGSSGHPMPVSTRNVTAKKAEENSAESYDQGRRTGQGGLAVAGHYLERDHCPSYRTATGRKCPMP